jgi:nucleotide-binding universal stress UspA family protein
VIVVGVDDSPGSLDAARWALGEASLRQTALHVVHVWGLPNMAGGTGFAPVPEPVLYDAARQGAEKVLKAVTSELAEVAAGVSVEASLVESSSVAGALTELAGSAELLVVGSRGHGALTGVLLGSVSQQVATHARCPVAIVPAAARTGTGAPRREGKEHVPVNWDFVG